MADLQPGGSRLVTWDGQQVALFNVEGRYYAIGNRCPHRGGPLVRGRIESVQVSGSGQGPVPDTVLAIRCPIHGWLFDLATGRCLNQPDASVPTYVVECQGDQVCVHPHAKGDLA